jgi:hypothetical protein
MVHGNNAFLANATRRPPAENSSRIRKNQQICRAACQFLKHHSASRILASSGGDDGTD